MSIILLNNPDFPYTVYTQYGIYVGLVVVAPLSTLLLTSRYVVSENVTDSRVNRMIENGIMLLAACGVVVIASTLLATQTPKASAVRRL